MENGERKDADKNHAMGHQRLIAILILGAVAICSTIGITVLRLVDIQNEPSLTMALGTSLGALTGILAKPPS